MSAICQAIEKYCLYGTLENCRNESELKYKQLVQKQVSEEEERKMELRIQQKLGGIDAILQKAAKLNPSIFSDELKAADTTKQVTSAILEEKKSQTKGDLSSIFLKQLKRSGTEDSIKPILRKTKDEVKALLRKREAAKFTALKAIRQKIQTKQPATFVPDKTFDSFAEEAAL